MLLNDCETTKQKFPLRPDKLINQKGKLAKYKNESVQFVSFAESFVKRI